jgi:cell division septation protein DedD
LIAAKIAAMMTAVILGGGMRGKAFGAHVGRKVVGAVFAASLMGALTAPAGFAQTVAQVGGPAELPPNGFSGQQYVDSRGCVFMRAGFAGQTTWVPRIGADRQPLCGQVTGAEASARLQEVAAPLPVSGTAPMATVASNMPSAPRLGAVASMQVPGLEQAGARPVEGSTVQMPNVPRSNVQMPDLAAARAPVASAPVASQAGGGQAGGGQAVGCPDFAPVLERVALRTGGTVAVCTRGDGSATGWVSPSYVASAKPGAAFRGPSGQGAGAAPRSQGVIAGARGAAPAAVQYEAAWQDDRLNPLRGLGTAQGWASQERVWTNTVPAQQVSAEAQARGQKASQVSASTRSAAAPEVTSEVGPEVGRQVFVQVGTFAQAGNVQNAAARLAALGLPVASAKGVSGGRDLVAVLAGPFASASAAQQALGMVRGAGFGDAFVR